MQSWLCVSAILAVCFLSGCGEAKKPVGAGAGSSPTKAATAGAPVEEAEKEKKPAGEASPTPIHDPVLEEVYAFRERVRGDFARRDFAELERNVERLRTEKPRFRNGSWKIVSFYEAISCEEGAADEVWREHEAVIQAWHDHAPGSPAARTALADFHTDEAWHIRGKGPAEAVAETAWKRIKERLAAALKLVEEVTVLPDRDPVVYLVALRVAMGQAWPFENTEKLLSEAHAYEPQFWGYDTARAQSLLPQWGGEAGDLEKYALYASSRTGGVGREVYARIVISLRNQFGDIFSETALAWNPTRDALAELRRKYPDALEFVGYTAYFATLANDQKLAREMFGKLGNSYHPGIWQTAERFSQFKRWAETGKW